MIPKKIYLNYIDEDDDEKTWSEEPVGVADCDLQSREYTDLSQVWHPASEEPQGNEWDILCNGLGWMLADQWVVKVGFGTEWAEFVKYHDITSWAYLSDLLPKGGER